MLKRLWIFLLVAAATTWGVGHALAADAVEASETAESADGTEAVAQDELARTDDGAAALSDGERQGIEDMWVTGKSGTQDIQSMAESITSFTGAEIEDRGITNFNNLQYNVPNLFSGGGRERT